MKVFCSNLALRVTTSIVGIIVLGSLYFYFPPFYFSMVIAAAGLWIIVGELPQLVKPTRLLFWILGLCYITFPLTLGIILNQNSTTQPLVLWALLITFGHDMSAYIGGNLYGKHKLVPTISPKKTWEGLLSGFLGTLFLFYILAKQPVTYLASTACTISVIISILAVSGDLFASYLKRKAGVKDTGTLLPGHGGMLDRLDSLLFVLPYVYLMQQELLPLIRKLLI